ncbi:MAG: UvrD-helicase domain-containing protein [Phycisphaerales bacterium]|jgi:DNA helicase II / ATP-dependent DNA helicase PcrA|nr:UvrD-helicase domain-containing protein [Phycisphaerales bacterium]MBT7171520.1 UvrD-helicase domain-containing protein [Phycisphaerales bacterium]
MTIQDSILDGLNDPQREAVQHVDGPLLVVAGAGSGKTRVITRRVGYLVASGIDPRNILAITFTNKAAGEMRERVEEMGIPYGATVCTFHALCARLLREFAPYANLQQNYTIYDRNDQLKAAKTAIAALNLTGGYITPGKAHSAISNAKNALQTARSYAENATDFYSRNIAEIYLRYEQILTKNNALDFDDLLLRIAFLLRDHGDIRSALSNRYRYLLVDEYQDTNHAQYLISQAIASSHDNYCATGDPDQSIYAWRGADIRNILDFEKDFPNAKTVLLEENYRSVQPILTCASNLIANNASRKDKRLFTTREGGENVHILLVDDEQHEAREIAERIDALRTNDGVPYNEMAIFYRVNSLSRVLEDALRRKGIPYIIARGVEFYNRKEIRDMLAYLRALSNPADDISCERIINTPARGIGAASIKKLYAHAYRTGKSLLAACREPAEAGLSTGPIKKVTAFSDMMEGLARKLNVEPLRRLISEIYTESGYEKALTTAAADGSEAKANIEELISSATEFDEENPDATVADFLQQVSLVSDTDRFDGAAGSVTLMTLHAAKGLEFPVVFMAGCEEGMLPFQRGVQMPGDEMKLDDLEEERRLAFVGITRAMRRLTMVSARTRLLRGQRTSASASRFLDELGEDATTREDLSTTMSAFDRFERATSRGGFFPSRKAKPKVDPYEASGFDEWNHAVKSAKPAKAKPAKSAGDFDAPADYGDEYETPIPPEYEYLRKGSRVRHRKFGTGEVMSLTRSWPDTRVKVHFQAFGQVKTLVLAMANLELLDG